MTGGRAPRRAGVHEAATVARLLHDFNAEFDSPVPLLIELQIRFEHFALGTSDAMLCHERAID